MIMYASFSLVIMNYVGVASCSVIAITTAVSLIRSPKADNPENADDRRSLSGMGSKTESTP